MKITVRVKTKGKKNEVEKVDDQYVVHVSAPPVEGRANAAVERAVADFFGVSPSRVRVVSGLRSKTKVIEIL